MHLTKPYFLVLSKNFERLWRKNLLQSITNLALDPRRDVLLDEVLHHRKVITMQLSLILEQVNLFIYSFFLLFKEISILFFIAKRSDSRLVCLQSLGVVFELLL